MVGIDFVYTFNLTNREMCSNARLPGYVAETLAANGRKAREKATSKGSDKAMPKMEVGIKKEPFVEANKGYIEHSLLKFKVSCSVDA